MTDRERLLEILNKPIFPHENVDPLEAVTDYLLDNGVRIPVLCEDCRRWKRTENCRHGICHLEGAELFKWQHDFCSYGERKGNETDQRV